MVRDDMERGIVTIYKNKGTNTYELISLPVFLRSSNICWKKCFSDNFFLRAFIFPHAKFLKTRNLHLLWLQTKLCLILTTSWLPVYKRFLLQHIFVYDWQCIIIYDNSHICCLWIEKVLGNKGKLVAWTLHRFYVLKLTHPLLYDDDTLTHASNDIKRIFLIVGSKILDGRSWSYLDIELCTISTLKRYNHYT